MDNIELDVQAIEKIILKAVPDRPIQVGKIGNETVFPLCRYFKSVCEPKDVTSQALKPYVRQWYELSKNKLYDENGELLTFSAVWSQFVDVWKNNRVKHPKGQKLALAIERARQRETPVPGADDYDDENFRLLLTVCFEWASEHVDANFHITQKVAGEIMEKSESSGKLALNTFIYDGKIELLKKGHTGRASTYRYIGLSDST